MTSTIERELTIPELNTILSTLVEKQEYTPVFILGPVGVGKSQTVKDIATKYGLELTDLRISQLTPPEVRGLPVADIKDNISRYLPPDFLNPEQLSPAELDGSDEHTAKCKPRILFLDEFTQAVPAMQGVCQQLIHDRRVGSTCLPKNCHVWAASNRITDKALVYKMPAPTANRFLHFSVKADWESFRAYAMQNGIAEEIIAFLSHQQQFLHKPHDTSLAFPTPRSWEMANKLLRCGLEIDSAVGLGTSNTFKTFCKVYKDLPDLDLIIAGKSKAKLPQEPSVGYATTLGLFNKIKTAKDAINSMDWLVRAGGLWPAILIQDMTAYRQDIVGEFAKMISSYPAIQKFMSQHERANLI